MERTSEDFWIDAKVVEVSNIFIIFKLLYKEQMRLFFGNWESAEFYDTQIRTAH